MALSTHEHYKLDIEHLGGANHTDIDHAGQYESVTTNESRRVAHRFGTERIVAPVVI